jgi:hypothetical protein
MHKFTVEDVFHYVYNQILHIQEAFLTIQQEDVYKNVHEDLIIILIILLDDVFSSVQKTH